MTVTTSFADINGITDKSAIVVIGETEFSWNSGRSEIQLACEALKLGKFLVTLGDVQSTDDLLTKLEFE